MDAPQLSRDDALRIAEADALRAYGDLSIYRVEVAETVRGWEVQYRIDRPRMAGGGPSYLIDPATGAIVWKRYCQ